MYQVRYSSLFSFTFPTEITLYFTQMKAITHYNLSAFSILNLNEKLFFNPNGIFYYIICIIFVITLKLLFAYNWVIIHDAS